jgi:hypothetical protein
MSDVITKVQNWYVSQCNGDWEHTHGVSIDTLDNPGWTVKIDLKNTPWEKVHFEELIFDRAPNDWVRCKKEGGQFKGCGDPSKLEFILNYFLGQVGSK